MQRGPCVEPVDGRLVGVVPADVACPVFAAAVAGVFVQPAFDVGLASAFAAAAFVVAAVAWPLAAYAAVPASVFGVRLAAFAVVVAACAVVVGVVAEASIVAVVAVAAPSSRIVTGFHPARW